MVVIVVVWDPIIVVAGSWWQVEGGGGGGGTCSSLVLPAGSQYNQNIPLVWMWWREETDCSVLSWLWRVSTGPSLCWAGSSSPPQRASWTISEIEKISARWVGLNSDWSTGHDSQLISSQVYFLDISTFTQYWVYKGRSDIIFINKQSKIVINGRKLQYFFISCPHCDSH